ncbi:MAG: ATP-grasp peptide maturase system methyltransferase [Nocardiopsaceae bacterium]|nr:ATP-grasp peptide maturase system methyltransferase [Nocardiopsaceae bacterium]
MSAHAAAARDERELLAAGLEASGALRSRRWTGAFTTVPRHVFVPRFYAGPGEDGEYELLDGTDPGQRERWLAEAYQDEPLPTEVEDGGAWRSSSSQPSLMARMLEALEVTGGERVLEIGTGTGYNAALLCEGLGSGRVVSIDIDAGLVETARGRLRQLGYSPVLAAADGAAGYPAGAPYDRIIATCSLPRVPAAWLAQMVPGGLIMVNLYRELGGGALALLRAGDGQASGHFAPFFGGFMPTRTVPPGTAIETITASAGQDGERRKTALAAGMLGDDAFGMLAALRLPGVQKTGLLPDGEPEQAWLTADDGSWAYQAEGSGTVVQGGPRRLWDLLEEAHRDWDALGRPGRGEFGLTVTSGGEHLLWCGDERRHEWPI